MARIIYQNEVFLRGIISDDFKYGKAVNGKDYCTFSLIVNADTRELSEESTSSNQFIRIMVFNNRSKRLVDYMREFGFRRGLYIGIVGRLQTSSQEYKGNVYVNLTVSVKDIYIIATKPIKKAK